MNSDTINDFKQAMTTAGLTSPDNIIESTGVQIIQRFKMPGDSQANSWYWCKMNKLTQQSYGAFGC